MLNFMKSLFVEPLTTRQRQDALADGAVLTRPDGKRLEFRDESWVGLLEAAKRYGHWQPGGTVAAAVKSFGQTLVPAELWDGKYIKIGEVTPWVGGDDAARLGEAIWHIAERFDDAGHKGEAAKFYDISMFVNGASRQGGFSIA